MARIAGVQLPNDKRIEIGLTYIYGIGENLSNEILDQVGINKDIRVKDLSPEDENKLKEIIEKSNKVEGDLRRDRMMNIKRLKEAGTYRGSRHEKGLPARGQSTKRNSRTVRGNVRKTAGSGRKASAEKT